MGITTCSSINPKKLASQNLPTDTRIPKAKPFLYNQPLYLSSSWVSHKLSKVVAEHKWIGTCDVVFTKHVVKFIPNCRQTHLHFHSWTLFSVWQKTAEIHSVSTSLTCAGVLLFTFWISSFPKPRWLWPCRLTPPLIFLYCLCPKTLREVLLLGVFWPIRIRQLRSHTHKFLTYPFLLLGALHLGSHTRICC